MFYISGYKDSLWQVTDTSDGVTEGYTLHDLKTIAQRGIEILGLKGNFAKVCNREGDCIFIADSDKNTLFVYSAKTGGIKDKLNFSRVDCPRNEPLLYDYIKLKLSKDKASVIVRCDVCVKFDYEFTGLYFLKVDLKTGYITSNLNEVLFICDDFGEIEEIKEQTCGDCPDFISSDEASRKLKAKGLV